MLTQPSKEAMEEATRITDKFTIALSRKCGEACCQHLPVPRYISSAASIPEIQEWIALALDQAKAQAREEQRIFDDEVLSKAIDQAKAEGAERAWLEGYNAHTREDDTGIPAKNPYLQTEKGEALVEERGKDK